MRTEDYFLLLIPLFFIAIGCGIIEESNHILTKILGFILALGGIGACVYMATQWALTS